MADPIVVGVDATDASLAALTAAAELARESAAPVIALHVRHEPAMAAVGNVAGEALAIETALDDVEALTRRRVTDVMARRHLDWRLEVTSGDPGTELIKAAIAHHADTIVVGGRSHGVVGGLLVGSVAQKLVRKSPVSVFVVRDGQAQRIKDASIATST